VRGPLSQPSPEPLERLGRAFRHHFHATIFEIANPTFQSQFPALPLGKCAKTHALNSAGNQVVFGEIHSPKLKLGRTFGKDFMPELTQGAPLASLIDHTLLKPEATYREIETLCAEADRYGFAS